MSDAQAFKFVPSAVVQKLFNDLLNAPKNKRNTLSEIAAQAGVPISHARWYAAKAPLTLSQKRRFGFGSKKTPIKPVVDPYHQSVRWRHSAKNHLSDLRAAHPDAFYRDVPADRLNTEFKNQNYIEPVKRDSMPASLPPHIKLATHNVGWSSGSRQIAVTLPALRCLAVAA